MLDRGGVGAPTIEVSHRLRRAGCVAMLAAPAPGLMLWWSLTSTCSGTCIQKSSWWVAGWLLMVLLALSGAIFARGAAAEVERGDIAEAISQLGCAGLCLTLPALLLSVPAVAASGFAIYLVVAIQRAEAAGNRGAGCFMIFVAMYATIGGGLALYVIPALVAGAMVRRVRRLLRG